MKKKVIFRLLRLALVLGLLAALIFFVIIPLYGPQPESTLPVPDIIFYEGSTKAVTMENEYLTFELDPNTTHFTVKEKLNGREWESNPSGAAKDSKAISSNKEMMQSTAIVTYTNAGGTIDLNNFKYSIENKNFDIKVQDDGSIRVDYAIGKIEKTYLMPTAISKERYDAFYSQMKSSTQKKLKSNYTLYEPDKLDSKKNKDEIIALYPEVLNQPLYILKSGTNDSNKKKIEGYFAEANYTQEDFEIDQLLVAGARDNNEPVFNVSMIYRLEGKDLVLEVPYSEFKYKADYPFTSLTILPMFGATGSDEEGFLLVPEGGGALIRYNNGKLSQNPYYAEMYGWDYALDRDKLVNETRMTFPVFGMTHDGGSCVCIMEGAAAYASIQADISMRYNSYNSIYAKYKVLHHDKYSVSAKTAQLVYMYEKEIPDTTIIHRYRFVDSDQYVAMATAYGDYLREEAVFQGQAASEQMPVSVELVGAIDKTVVKLGLPIDSVVATTTFAQAKDIVKELSDAGLQNMHVRMSGWANGGVNQSVLTKVKVNKELGGKKSMQELIAAAKAEGVMLYFDGVTCFAYDSDILDGFLPFRDAARLATREEVELYPYDIVTYFYADWLDTFYLVQPSYAKKCADNLIAYLADADAAGVAFRDIGYLLSGDYNSKKNVTREQTIAMNIENMQAAAAAGQQVMIRQGNEYALPYVDIVTDMDLIGTRYSILDQHVPFYQIAIHGLKDYTGKSMTTSGDMRMELLYCAEYGSGLNFTFMAEDAKVLQDTTHSGFYGTQYSSWAEDVTRMALQYQEDMAGLNQQRIVEHARLSEHLTVTAYEDGTKVYVNYGKLDEAYEGVQVPAMSYYVERGN